MRLGHDLLFLFPTVGTILSLALVAAVLVSAVQHKREAERLRVDNAAKDRLIASFERKLDEGDFFIQTCRLDRPGGSVGQVLWRDIHLDDAVERGDSKMSPRNLAEAHKELVVGQSQLERERDEAQAALKAKKAEYAHEVLA